ncbi:hypothetical protein [Dankookia sp. P2]|uniref:hypothetical protein n=1 Tax=Dankookia sp. P2 TaxID=3423955 RepID=UPI003D67652B
MVTGLDLVEWQLRVAAGEALPRLEAPAPQGHSVEVRLYAEDPAQDFRPSTGPLRRFSLPAPAPDLRIETGVSEGDTVTPFYDPMIAKLVAWGPDRDAALARLGVALGECRIAGITSNLGFLQRLVGHPAMRAALLDTGFAGRFAVDLQPPVRPAPALALAAAALEAVLPTAELAVRSLGAPGWLAPAGRRLATRPAGGWRGGASPAAGACRAWLARHAGGHRSGARRPSARWRPAGHAGRRHPPHSRAARRRRHPGRAAGGAGPFACATPMCRPRASLWARGASPRRFPAASCRCW